MPQWIWVPFILIHYSIYSWLSIQVNLYPEKSIWIVLLVLLGAIGQYWVFVSMFSKNLILDAIIYDISIVFSHYLTFVYFGQASSFLLHQWLGAILVFIGIVLIKLEIPFK